MSPEDITQAFLLAWALASGAWLVWYALGWAKRGS